MGRKKRRGEIRQLMVELDLSDPDQQRIWMHWLELTTEGRAGAWVRETLIGSLTPSQRSKVYTKPNTVYTKSEPDEKLASGPTFPADWNQRSHSVPKPGGGKPKREPKGEEEFNE